MHFRAHEVFCMGKANCLDAKIINDGLNVTGLHLCHHTYLQYIGIGNTPLHQVILLTVSLQASLGEAIYALFDANIHQLINDFVF